MAKTPEWIRYNVDRWRLNEDAEDRMRHKDRQAEVQAQYAAERKQILDSAEHERAAGNSLNETIAKVLGRTSELRSKSDPHRQHEIAINDLFDTEGRTTADD